VVGINLEDGLHGPIRSIEDAAARLGAARDTARREGVPIVLNARCDIFHLQHGEETRDSPRRSSAVRRISPPAPIASIPSACAILRRLPHWSKRSAARQHHGRPGMPNAATFEQIGVARITIASAPTLVAMSTIQKLAADLRATGGFDMLTATLRHPDAQKLFQMKG